MPRATRPDDDSSAPVVWVRQELFQQRVCPTIDVDLIAAYKLVEHLRAKARTAWGLFTLDAWIASCREVLNLSDASAHQLFEGYKIMESWSAYDAEFPVEAVSAAGGQSKLGSIPLMAQFLFVRNYVPPTATATDIQLQVESVYPGVGDEADGSTTGGSVENGDGGGANSGSPRTPRSTRKKLQPQAKVLGKNKPHSWSSLMKLRQSSADQHFKYVLKNFKSLLRLTVHDLADQPIFERAKITRQEVHHFGFLFGACAKLHPDRNALLRDLFLDNPTGGATRTAATVKTFEAWMKQHLVAVPYGDDMHDPPHGKSASPTNASASVSGSAVQRVSPLNATSGHTLYIGRKSDASTIVDERHFAHKGLGGGSGAGNTHSTRGRSVSILQCSQSSIFIVAPVAFLRIVGCSNCSIFVSAVRFNVTIENCEFCQVSSTTRSISVCNCVDTTLYTCTTSPPVLAGDCRGIRLAPNGSFHHRDLPILAQASFPGVSNQRQSPGSLEADAGDALPHNFWGEPVEDNGRDHHYVNLGAGASKPKGANWSILPADEFLPALVPYQDTTPNPGTGVSSHKASDLDMRQYPRWRRLPQPYASVAQTRAAKALSLQKTIEASGVQPQAYGVETCFACADVWRFSSSSCICTLVPVPCLHILFCC
eukprot:INCI6498.1.p1 GENE.INCI6498.1~~INCI6498.1.p1  ORF type:complete len:652 (+),score=104.91 INCI6498.1:531-2486(+)